MDFISLPIDDADVFVGRVVEGKRTDNAPNYKICSVGHLTPNYGSLIKEGYKGILEKIERNTADIGTAEAKFYADNARVVINAVRSYALRYSAEAEKCGKTRAA